MPLVTLSRRGFTAGLVGASSLPLMPAWANAGGASRTFGVFRGDTPIGTHKVSVRREGDQVIAGTDVKIAVKVLGITLYRYELDVQETYASDGRLLSMRGTCNDDGTPNFVNVDRQGDTLTIEGSSYSGPVAGNASPSSYWRKASVRNTPWISTQSGEIFEVVITPTAVPGTPSGGASFNATDGDGVNIDVIYDAQGEWVGSGFDAKGERATYRMTETTGALNIV